MLSTIYDGRSWLTTLLGGKKKPKRQPGLEYRGKETGQVPLFLEIRAEATLKVTQGHHQWYY